MPSETTPNARPANVTISKPTRLLAEEARILPATKRVATLRRQREALRAEKLDWIRDQIADGTLVVRHMTVAQHEEASRVACRTLARNQASRELKTAGRKHDA